MSEPYLILHKCRGQPAFDIAHRLQIGDEEGWILSTCGYRAYPYAQWSLASLSSHDYDSLESAEHYETMPKDAPDCFACNDRPQREESYVVKAKAAGLLQSLGLIKKIERRL